ncbi:hypothetical protein HDG40_005660 [Paraburkholderia sp. JPY158]|uniref:Uncharacterized protein n=1 Tax=Paraburkholderia atlantica TaxID=2654982 RepID=A0A7W8V8T3_PARAM|nr:hypothetical protein [Paraburkholderia atlantica]MBB5427481.1 hypothetical protein [Paraburkholderia atlantica]
MNYERFLRDAWNDALTPSTRVRAAFDALYVCLIEGIDTSVIERTDNSGRFAEAVVELAIEALQLTNAEASLLHQLAVWVIHQAPSGPMPMQPREAVELAEHLHHIVRGLHSF